MGGTFGKGSTPVPVYEVLGASMPRVVCRESGNELVYSSADSHVAVDYLPAPSPRSQQQLLYQHRPPLRVL